MFRFVNGLFGCTHRHCTFPRTAKKGAVPAMYVVCLDCGKEFPYDWQAMRVVTSAKNKQGAVA
jgi:hypothetical protein